MQPETISKVALCNQVLRTKKNPEIAFGIFYFSASAASNFASFANSAS